MEKKPNKPSKNRRKRVQLPTESLAESRNMMDLLANEYILPNPTPSQEPDEFELFLRAVEQFSAQQFIEKAEQVQVSEESLCYLQSSVERKEELISETLADLLAQQGKTKQAVQMYERLSAQQPQKQAIFLSKIKQLQP